MNQRLVIRDLPASGVQLHLHTDASGTAIRSAKLKTHAGDTVRRLSSYEAAMADAGAEALGLRRIVR